MTFGIGMVVGIILGVVIILLLFLFIGLIESRILKGGGIRSVTYYSLHSYGNNHTSKSVLNDKVSTWPSICGTALENKVVCTSTDKDGFLLPSSVSSKQEAVLYFLGDSVLMESLLIDENNRVHFLVKKKLYEDYHRDITCLNRSIYGMRIKEALQILSLETLKYKPTFLIFNNVMSEIGKGLCEVENINPIYRTDEVSLKKRVWNTLNAYSPSLGQKIGKWYGRKGKKAYDWDKYFLDADNEIPIVADQDKVNNLISYYFDMLRVVVAFCRANGIVPILMTQLCSFCYEDNLRLHRIYHEHYIKTKISYQEFSDIFYRANEAVRKVARLDNVSIIDPDRDLEYSEKIIYDSVHYTDEGSFYLADLIAKNIDNLMKKGLHE